MLNQLINPGNIIGNHGNSHSHGFHHASGNALQGGGHHEKVETGKRSEEHTSELQSRPHLVCRLLLEKKKKKRKRKKHEEKKNQKNNHKKQNSQSGKKKKKDKKKR